MQGGTPISGHELAQVREVYSLLMRLSPERRFDFLITVQLTAMENNHAKPASIRSSPPSSAIHDTQ
jgi:hypothetical protein